MSKNVITDMSYDFIADLAQTQLNDMAAWNITQISVTELEVIHQQHIQCQGGRYT